MIELGLYAGQTPEQIEEDLRSKGYSPIKDSDEPGFVYEPHTHDDADNIIVVLEGEMKVEVGGRTETLRTGDKVTFPAKVLHASVIGPEGCQYFWVELRA